jgi:hypothetical protein
LGSSMSPTPTPTVTITTSIPGTSTCPLSASFPVVGSIPRNFSPQGYEQLWNIVSPPNSHLLMDLVHSQYFSMSRSAAQSNLRPSQRLLSPLCRFPSLHLPLHSIHHGLRPSRVT